MKTKRKFVTPRVIQTVELCPELDILGKSLEDVTQIISMGQEREVYNFDGSDAEYSAYYE